jgi:sugar O-acyltransferase (sialic acid O-acetyltransferase NeuD family)|tara:strand:- start:1766 stop:2389 length:624 start_codon:yes stop_codon:yes gene_type:complete
VLDKKLILVGYSGHGLVVADVALENGLNLVGYIDIEEKKSNPFNLKFLGSEKNLGIKFFKEPYQFILGIGDINLRKKIADYINSEGGEFSNIVDSSASISKTVTLRKGSFISKNVAINAFASIGENCILNTGSIVEHECLLGNNVHISPGAVLAGNVRVGDDSFIGANAVIKQGVTIGNNVVVGAGSVVIKDIKDNMKIVGNPGREI